ncbi:hypothetical protein HWC14_gp57 [Serratia phage Parlo]|uniref:Uncharacterized protein n=1 Tax=Serratia phage Parlo TaxID=2557554 RepID=A0A482MH10_9CAUD|nr:hypothetical protein HWC14_gp57 [Serratia phage Parlo]QBQ72206.1 hypothetical protein CPT_Parlo_057 [Serratia phage Parlo]
MTGHLRYALKGWQCTGPFAFHRQVAGSQLDGFRRALCFPVQIGAQRAAKLFGRPFLRPVHIHSPQLQLECIHKSPGFSSQIMQVLHDYRRFTGDAHAIIASGGAG